jgi:hypothetical protein
MVLTRAFRSLALALALAWTPALATAAGHEKLERHGSDAQKAKEDIDDAKESADKAKKLREADPDDVKAAGKAKAKDEAKGAARDSIHDSVR